jgi:hypothetical protein
MDKLEYTFYLFCDFSFYFQAKRASNVVSYFECIVKLIRAQVIFVYISPTLNI